MTSKVLFLGGVAFLLLLTACKSTRVASDERNIPNLKTEELIDSIATHDLNCGWVSIKYDVEIKTSKLDESFKLYVRMRQDSVIWVSATYYAVEIARFLFTPDSVKYMDRRNNKFYVGNYDYITETFLIEANFETLQAVLLANGAAFTDFGEEKVRTSRDKGQYYFSYLRKGQIKRAMKKDELKNPIDLVVSLWVEPDGFRISKTMLYDFEDDRTLTARFLDFQPTCNSAYPATTEISIDAGNEHIEVKTSVIKFSSEKELSFSFTIPEKYEPLVP